MIQIKQIRQMRWILIKTNKVCLTFVWTVIDLYVCFMRDFSPIQTEWTNEQMCKQSIIVSNVLYFNKIFMFSEGYRYAHENSQHTVYCIWNYLIPTWCCVCHFFSTVTSHCNVILSLRKERKTKKVMNRKNITYSLKWWFCSLLLG